MIKLRLTSEILPPKGQWVLVTTEDWQKPWEIMCYLGERTNERYWVSKEGKKGWEEYTYPAWTSGHGDIQSKHPYGWMPLPNHLLHNKDIKI